MVLGIPVVAITLLLVMERLAHIGIFDPGRRWRSRPVPTSVLV
jgi:hypothetical protein